MIYELNVAITNIQINNIKGRKLRCVYYKYFKFLTKFILSKFSSKYFIVVLKYQGICYLD